jgi:hypothetical protein
MASSLIFGFDALNLFLIGTFVFVSVIFWLTRFGRSNKWLQFIGMISGLGVSVFVLQFVLENQRQHEQKKKERALSFTVMTERYVINLEKWFAEQYPYSTRLYKELYPGHPGLENTIVPSNVDKNHQTEAEAHICAILIQAVEDVYWVENLETNYADPDLSGWMTTFIRWFTSPILQIQWTYLKKNYGEPFQQFVDEKLIKAGAPQTGAPITQLP